VRRLGQVPRQRLVLIFVKAKKELGQHWLHDASTLESICNIAEVGDQDFVLEIGPGLGTLTEHLLAYGATVTAVEFDEDLSVKLQQNAGEIFSDEAAAKLTIVNEDILKFDLTKLPAGYKVVANIPYYLTSNLVRVLSESANPPSSVTMLIQKEVAERIAAGPGGMSLLSVTAQMYFEPSLGPVVPAEYFSPPPKIDSQVIHLRRRNQPLFKDMDPRAVFRLVKAGFSNRRKTLLNSLAAGMHLSKDDTKALLERAGVNAQARPQELDLEDWLRLSRKI
jgi:16S rRNA (adenine1518-N6/adenine1519-N6)-dimethyltransferase